MSLERRAVALLRLFLVLLFGVLGLLLSAGLRADGPGLLLLLFVLAVAVAVLGLLVVVVRALLRQATTLRTDLEAVI